MGRGGSCVDNGSAGGIFIAVDDDGTLHASAFDKYAHPFTEHPDTHTIFQGRKILFTEKVIAAAKKLHSQIPQVGMINWDFTIDQDGDAVLVEGNMFYGGGSRLMQMSHGRGIFGDNTTEILHWMRDTKKIKRVERIKCMYGKILQH